MIRYVDLTPEHGISEYSAAQLDKQHAMLMQSGGKQVESVTADQIIEQGIGCISVRSAHSLTEITVPSFPQEMSLVYENSKYSDTTENHLAVPVYAKFTMVTDFVPDTYVQVGRLGMRKKTIHRVYPPDFEEGKLGNMYNIAFTEAVVGEGMSPLHLLTAMEGLESTRNPGLCTAFRISEVLDIVIK